MSPNSITMSNAVEVKFSLKTRGGLNYWVNYNIRFSVTPSELQRLKLSRLRPIIGDLSYSRTTLHAEKRKRPVAQNAVCEVV